MNAAIPELGPKTGAGWVPDSVHGFPFVAVLSSPAKPSSIGSASAPGRVGNGLLKWHHG